MPLLRFPSKRSKGARWRTSAGLFVLVLAHCFCESGRAQDERMAQMRSMSNDLGVECTACHLADDWSNNQKPQFAAAARMIRMTDGLSAGTLKAFGGVTCWTCHRGKTTPARMPRAGWEDHLAHWPADARVSEEDAKKPAQQVFRNIQSLKDSPAGGLPMTMSVFAAALGVGCDYCHVPAQWESDQKSTKQTARSMLRLFSEVPKYFEGAKPPSLQCFTCHQGAPKPQHRADDRRL